MTSSSRKPFRNVVFVDIPDPDNILMILHTLAVSKRRVAIVLSPRILDLSAVRYGPLFSDMKEKLGFRTLFEPITEGNEPAVCKEWKEYFQADHTLSDSEVMKDTEIYVHLSAVRIRECIEEQYPKSKDYEIFWDPNSLSKIEKPDTRHAIHVPDYTFNFNDNERRKYEKIIEKHRETVKGGKTFDARQPLRELCQEYIDRQSKINSHPTDIKYLYKVNEDEEKTRFIVGGPLTEPLEYLKHTYYPPKIVYAMLGTLTDDRTILGRPQFNIGKDPQSANSFFEKISQDNITMLIVPTECCKGKGEKNPSPFELRRNEWMGLLKYSPLMSKIVASYVGEAGKGNYYQMFDWVAAIAVKRRDILKWVPVRHRKCLREGIITDIKFSETTESTTLLMAKEDIKYMRDMKKVLWEEAKKAFPRNAAVPVGQ